MNEPLRITATLSGGVSLPSGPLALDALLIAAVATRDNLPPPGFAPLVDIAIPVDRSTCGRVYLASFSIATWESHERRFTNRRFPLEQAQTMGNAKLTRIQLSAGNTKSYRIPGEVAFAEDDELTWFAVGDAEQIRDLLTLITHLGKRRAVGRGKVRSWSIDACTTWPGFPVVRDGKPLRALPSDWPGLVDPVLARAVASPPYWENWRAEECAVPSP